MTFISQLCHSFPNSDFDGLIDHQNMTFISQFCHSFPNYVSRFKQSPDRGIYWRNALILVKTRGVFNKAGTYLAFTCLPPDQLCKCSPEHHPMRACHTDSLRDACLVQLILQNTIKILNIGTPEIITIIILQLEQLDFTVQYWVQKMQTE